MSESTTVYIHHPVWGGGRPRPTEANEANEANDRSERSERSEWADGRMDRTDRVSGLMNGPMDQNERTKERGTWYAVRGTWYVVRNPLPQRRSWARRTLTTNGGARARAAEVSRHSTPTPVGRVAQRVALPFTHPPPRLSKTPPPPPSSFHFLCFCFKLRTAKK